MSILHRPPLDGSPKITQRFGEHPASYARFGLLGHNGIDFAVPVGAGVFAVAPGTVVEADFDAGGYGNYIKVQTVWGEYLVAHLSRIDVRLGEPVAPGRQLGQSGNTGNSTGPHLHFAMRINPYDRRDGEPAGSPSWLGYSDPLPYLARIGSDQDLLGVHFIGQSAPMLPDMRRMQPTVCTFVDPDPTDLAAFRAACPKTEIVVRLYEPDGSVADRIRANPVAAARYTHDRIMAQRARGIEAHFWQGIRNEVCQVAWTEFNQLIAYELEYMRLADSAGYKVGIFAFSVGQPDLPASDRMGFWRATYPALDYAEAHGHALLIHEYGCCPDIWGPAERGGAPWFLDRWVTQVRPHLRQRMIKVKRLETGYDGLIQEQALAADLFATRGKPRSRDLCSPARSRTARLNPGWKTVMSAETYAKQLFDHTTWMERYAGQVTGSTVFQAGDNATWANYNVEGRVLNLLAAGRQDPAPVEPPPPPPDPIPTPPGGTVMRRLGKGILNQRCTVIPWNERTDYNPAMMTEDTVVWELIDAFTTHNGSWEPNEADPWAIDQWAKLAYLFPQNDPRCNLQGGGDVHLQVCVQASNGSRLAGAGVLYTSDGPQWLQTGNPAAAGHIISRNTENSGWANIPIAGGGSTSHPPTPGPWSMTKFSWGLADILVGMGLPSNNHVSTFGVWQAKRYGDIVPVYPTLGDAVHAEAQKAQVIELNKDAALQKRIFADGFVPTSPEFDFTYNGVAYRGQRAEHLGSGLVHTYYVVIPVWDNIMVEAW